MEKISVTCEIAIGGIPERLASSVAVVANSIYGFLHGTIVAEDTKQ